MILFGKNVLIHDLYRINIRFLKQYNYYFVQLLVIRLYDYALGVQRFQHELFLIISLELRFRECKHKK